MHIAIVLSVGVAIVAILTIMDTIIHGPNGYVLFNVYDLKIS